MKKFNSKEETKEYAKNHGMNYIMGSATTMIENDMLWNVVKYDDKMDVFTFSYPVVDLLIPRT